MKFLTALFAVLSFSVIAARADESAPATPVPAPAAPVQSAPVTPPVAKEPEEDTKPGGIKARLDAALAMFTGNHASLETVEAKDATIASLTAQLAAANAQITSLKATIENQAVDAENYLRDIIQGKIDIKKNPPASGAQKVIFEGVQQATAANLRNIGVSADLLDAPSAPVATAPVLGMAGLSAAFKQAAGTTEHTGN